MTEKTSVITKWRNYNPKFISIIHGKFSSYKSAISSLSKKENLYINSIVLFRMQFTTILDPFFAYFITFEIKFDNTSHIAASPTNMKSFHINNSKIVS